MTTETTVTPKKTARKPAGPSRILNGIRVPALAFTYKVLRATDEKPPETPPDERTWGTMSLHVSATGMRRDMFKVEGEEPTPEALKVLWGSGTYRFAWFQVSGEGAGLSRPLTIDDPAHPQKPGYANAPGGAPPLASAPAAAAAPAARVDPVTMLLQSRAGEGGKVDLSDAVVAIHLMRQMREDADQEREATYRRWREEDERRSSQREREHEQALQRERTRADEDMRRTNLVWQQTLEAARTASAPPAAPATATDSRLLDLLERVEDRLETLEELAEEREEAEGGGSMLSQLKDLAEAAPALTALLSLSRGAAAQEAAPAPAAAQNGAKTK
jgi:hypothetical protein